MRRSMGITILQIALVFFLLVSGVTGLMQSTAGNLNPVVTFLTQLVKSSTISTIIIIAIAVCELIATLPSNFKCNLNYFYRFMDHQYYFD